MLVRAHGLAYLSMTVRDRMHFVYGSLMDKDVLTTLMGRVPELVPGTLRGYRRYRVPNQGEKRQIPPESNTQICLFLMFQQYLDTDRLIILVVNDGSVPRYTTWRRNKLCKWFIGQRTAGK